MHIWQCVSQQVLFCFLLLGLNKIETQIKINTFLQELMSVRSNVPSSFTNATVFESISNYTDVKN